MDRLPWPTEAAHQEALGLLRDVAAEHDVTGVVPAPSALPATPGPAPAEVVTAPSATDVTAQAQALMAAGWTPPSSPEPVVAPEQDNAFATVDPAPSVDAPTS